MKIVLGGLQKTTLVDFPGRVACTVFTYGCNFKCGFCHNPGLVNRKGDIFDNEEFFRFLKGRKRLLDGVCITGGEPMIHEGLEEFCGKIKELGLEIKLDTNGTNPEALRSLIKKKLIDMVAMDVKTSWDKYKVVGVGKKEVDKVKDSMSEILSSGVEYELRTTVVPTMHSVGILKRTAKQIEEVARSVGVDLDKVIWIWQRFEPGHCLEKKFNDVDKFDDNEEGKMLTGVKQVLAGTRWR